MILSYAPLTINDYNSVCGVSRTWCDAAAQVNNATVQFIHYPRSLEHDWAHVQWRPTLKLLPTCITSADVMKAFDKWCDDNHRRRLEQRVKMSPYLLATRKYPRVAHFVDFPLTNDLTDLIPPNNHDTIIMNGSLGTPPYTGPLLPSQQPNGWQLSLLRSLVNLRVDDRRRYHDGLYGGSTMQHQRFQPLINVITHVCKLHKSRVVRGRNIKIGDHDHDSDDDNDHKHDSHDDDTVNNSNSSESFVQQFTHISIMAELPVVNDNDTACDTSNGEIISSYVEHLPSQLSSIFSSQYWPRCFVTYLHSILFFNHERAVCVSTPPPPASLSGPVAALTTKIAAPHYHSRDDRNRDLFIWPMICTICYNITHSCCSSWFIQRRYYAIPTPATARSAITKQRRQQYPVCEPCMLKWRRQQQHGCSIC
jgi:hypothetical protein